MKRRSKTRRNPFPSDPSLVEPPDGDWVMSPRYKEFDGGRQSFGDYVVEELPGGNYRVTFNTEATSVWRSYGWSRPIPASISIRAGESFFVETYPSGNAWYLKRVGDVLRIYRIFDRRDVRENPLVHDPSYTSAPPAELEVAKLLVDYDYREQTGIVRYPRYEITRGHRVSFNDDQSVWLWDASRKLWKRLLDGSKSIYMYPNRIAFVTTNDETLMLQRGETLRIYRLREVRS